MLDPATGVEGLIREGAPEYNGTLDPFYSTLLDEIAYVANETSGFVVPLSYGAAGASYQQQSRRVQEATICSATARATSSTGPTSSRAAVTSRCGPRRGSTRPARWNRWDRPAAPAAWPAPARLLDRRPQRSPGGARRLPPRVRRLLRPGRPVRPVCGDRQHHGEPDHDQLRLAGAVLRPSDDVQRRRRPVRRIRQPDRKPVRTELHHGRRAGRDPSLTVSDRFTNGPQETRVHWPAPTLSSNRRSCSHCAMTRAAAATP